MFNLDEWYNMILDVVRSIFQWGIVISFVILLAALLLIFITRGNKGIKAAVGSFAIIVACVALSYLIFGEIPSIPSFPDFFDGLFSLYFFRYL
ncbi:MAG: hypothetical protein GF329_16205 [Candidatus Lokiarchaeota archaeon]|nr:hypothetical protein [Candidatus Lokiarchaeota archaeon]